MKKNKCQHGPRAPCLFLRKFIKKRSQRGREMARGKIAKSYEMTDAKITFVSLVGKAANKKQFIITKSEDGKATFQTYGRILCADPESHYVTGIVYEPMVEDTQGNYMTEEEITKAAHWFAKNGNQVDLQHSFEPLEGAVVVESSVTKCDMELEGQQIKKGTWLMTVEITDPEIYASIQKGDITGFSMGGTGTYSLVDTDISDGDPVEKDVEGKKRSILKQLGELLGIGGKTTAEGTVEKGKVMDKYLDRTISDNFWNAFYALQDTLLYSYNPETDRWERTSDEQTITDALQEFNKIITDILTSGTGDIWKSEGGPLRASILKADIQKAGKCLSKKNKATLKSIHASLGDFLSQYEDDEEEDEEVKKSELESIVKSAVEKYLDADATQAGAGAPQTGAGAVEKGAGEEKPEGDEITPDLVEKMVQDAITKAINKPVQKEEDVTVNAEDIGKMIEKAVNDAIAPVFKAAGIPTNLNDTGKTVEKSEQHYLHGLL